jgi:hypothetical protein
MNCGLEIAMEDGTWERVGARVFGGDAFTRPAAHEWEPIPPHYARCPWCRAVEVLQGPTDTEGQ